MNITFLLMAQYGALAIIPLERVCADYFSHLTPDKLKRKVADGSIDLPLIRIEGSQKAACGVALTDLAKYLDEQHRRATVENDKLHGRHLKRAS